MTDNNKKVYLVYSGDAIPYEPTYVRAAFLNKDKAEEYLKKLREDDKKKL